MNEREIEFRGKRKDNGEWVKDSLILSEDGNRAFIGHIRFLEDGMPVASYQEVIPETVGQYTGLKDRKRTPEYPEGQEIYEGDIVKLDTPEADVFKTRNRAIIFNPTFAQFCVDPCTSIAHWPSVEVIGTLHENPELQEAQP